MDISGVNNLSESSDSIKYKKVESRKDSKRSSNTDIDNVIISNEAKSAYQEKALMKKVNELPEVRREIVERVKSQIADGTLLTSDALEQTAERILHGLSEE
ncbi:MAG: hypothetical protein ACD_79C01270G0002 [uncultured bacterium]|nr:MAG: hypothetical protein ACD_79C01270G0002 [uncultured bacterium]